MYRQPETFTVSPKPPEPSKTIRCVPSSCIPAAWLRWRQALPVVEGPLSGWGPSGVLLSFKEGFVVVSTVVQVVAAFLSCFYLPMNLREQAVQTPRFDRTPLELLYGSDWGLVFLCGTTVTPANNRSCRL